MLLRGKRIDEESQAQTPLSYDFRKPEGDRSLDWPILLVIDFYWVSLPEKLFQNWICTIVLKSGFAQPITIIGHEILL